MPDSFDHRAVGDSLVVALNGAYGLLSIASLEDRAITPEYVMRLSFVPFAMSMGADTQHVEEVIKECSLLQEVQ